MFPSLARGLCCHALRLGPGVSVEAGQDCDLSSTPNAIELIPLKPDASQGCALACPEAGDLIIHKEMQPMAIQARLRGGRGDH